MEVVVRRFSILFSRTNNWRLSKFRYSLSHPFKLLWGLIKIPFYPGILFEISIKTIVSALIRLAAVHIFLLGVLISISVSNQSCTDAKENRQIDSICYFNDWTTRDAVCNQRDETNKNNTRYSYPKINFLGMRTGKCYCCSSDPPEPEDLPTQNLWPLLTGTLGTLLVVVVTSLICGMRKSIKKASLSTEAEAEIRIEDYLKESLGKTMQKYSKELDSDILEYYGATTNKERNEQKIRSLPKSSFSYDRLGAKLGEGQFGIVYQGSYLDEENQGIQKVAVKTVKTPTQEFTQCLLNEMKVIAYLGSHPNIVCLIGCCFEEINEGLVCGILEFCEYGDLRGYLKYMESNYVKHPNLYESSLEGYKEWVSLSKTGYVKRRLNKTSKDCLQQFLTWGKEIACGMQFLTSKKVIHVDLAARNVLVAQDLTAKIGDFGLSRKLYDYPLDYQKTTNGPLPIKWMALESIMSQKYSSKSDVWSFGVTLWEIFTFGTEPYGALSAKKFMSLLSHGVRLPCPQFCTPQIFKVMSSCWSESPDERPKFTELVEQFQVIQLSFGEPCTEAKPLKEPTDISTDEGLWSLEDRKSHGAPVVHKLIGYTLISQATQKQDLDEDGL